MTQRKAYKYALVPDGIGPKSGCLFLALKRIPIPGSDFPRSSKTRKQNQVLETENTVRHMESGNGNSIFSPKEVSL
jgi:hypothetical protein